MSDSVILTINAGSSSIKFSVYAFEGGVLRETVSGQVDGLGADRQTQLTIEKLGEAKRQQIAIDANNHAGALADILTHAPVLFGGATVVGVGHRIVHGGIHFDGPTVLDDAVLAQLETLCPLAPLHQPHNLAAVHAAQSAFPEAIQVGSFDTAFHRSHPWVNDTFGLPRQFYEEGVRRYGFHGLSYNYITSELQRTEPLLAKGDVIVAHLGNGASMAAIRDGKSIASTMGFSALDGLAMGTRCGQLDPGVVLYMMQHYGMDADAISHLLYNESGLKGQSGLTNDMRVLEVSDDPAAQEAIDYYVFRIRREIGAMAASMAGVNGLVFCGGIGENSAFIRERVCRGFDWMGIELDRDANATNAREIGEGRVRVLVVPTDEEVVLARGVVAVMGCDQYITKGKNE